MCNGESNTSRPQPEPDEYWRKLEAAGVKRKTGLTGGIITIPNGLPRPASYGPATAEKHSTATPAPDAKLREKYGELMLTALTVIPDDVLRSTAQKPNSEPRGDAQSPGTDVWGGETRRDRVTGEPTEPAQE
jgi:hypothetical protein